MGQVEEKNFLQKNENPCLKWRDVFFHVSGIYADKKSTILIDTMHEKMSYYAKCESIRNDISLHINRQKS